MGKIKNIFICAAAVVGLFASCAKDRTLPENAVQGITVKVSLPTTTVIRAAGAPENGTAEENKITNLKIFIAKVISVNDATIEKIYNFDPSISQTFDASNSWDATTQSLQVRQLDSYDGSRSIIAIANWANDLSGYRVGGSYLKLKDEFTQSEGEVVSPFVMSGGELIDQNDQNYTVKLQRQPIKVEVTVALDAKFAAAYPDFDFGVLTPTMGVHSTPNCSSLIYSEQGVAGSQYVNIAQKNTEQITSGEKSWKATFYLYENPIKGTDINNATKFILLMPYQRTGGETKSDNYYTILLRTDNETTPYKTDRNTIYRVSATINGFGSTTPVDIPSNIKATVSVVPWNDEAYDDQIGGAKLGVNVSAINIRGGVVNTQLVVTSDNLRKVTFADVSNLLTTPTIDGTTGVVSVNTKTHIGLYTPNYATFKVKRGNLSKTITVDAGLWSSGNIIYSNGAYIHSTNQLEDGLCFFSGSNVGLEYLSPTGTPWTIASKYYVSENGKIVEKNGVAIWDDTKLKSTGDPCGLIAPHGDWRLPNKAEFDDLVTNLNSWDNATKSTVFYNNTLNLKWAGAGVRGAMYEYNSIGLYWTKEGDVLSKIELFPATTDIFFKYRTETFDAFTVRCVHK